MAAKKKPQFPTVYTPAGVGKYMWLTKPDNYLGEEQFKARILLNDNEANRAWVEAQIELAKKVASANEIRLKKNFKTPFQFPEDQDEDDFVPQEGKDKPKLDEDHRGKIFFSVKSSYRPAVIGTVKNEKGEFSELPDGTLAMSGDEIRLKLQLVPYDGLGSGLSYRLQGCQLLAKRSGFKGSVGGGWDELPEGYGEESQTEGHDDDLEDEVPF